MQALGKKIIKQSMLAVLVMAAVAGCSRNSEPKLLNLSSSSNGPDEFAILPNKPLQEPASYSDLPAPTPGGVNRVDASPEADAIAALGGNPAVVARGISSSDAGLVNYASRQGRTPGIRQELAASDLEFRQRKQGRLLERAFNVNVYNRAYRGQSLNKYAELERFRRLGVRTPAAPPAPAE